MKPNATQPNQDQLKADQLKTDQLKTAAAKSAVALVADGMVVGLGSGSTAAFAVKELGRRVQEGLRIVGIPTSESTAAQARAVGIPLVSLEQYSSIDLTIDGADQVEEGTLNLVKGHGGALLREKIVASASKKLVIAIHEAKLAHHLVLSEPVPVEVVPFGWQATLLHLSRHFEKPGARASLRRNPDGAPYLSDEHNYILDCTFAPGVSAPSLAKQLDHVVGVVEHGLFIGLSSEVHVAGSSGVRVLTRDI